MTKTIYFPGLNGVRFFASFLVILDHLELFKSNFGYKAMWSSKFSAHLGSSGVTIFFVLSGFLITYLLLKEKESSEINIKNFYIRRILRIWPLYYLIILISFFIIPHIAFFNVPSYGENISNHFGLKLTCFSLLLANVAFVYLPMVAFGNVLWSVAVEEQFYFIWPHIIKYFKNTLIALLTIFFMYMFIKFCATINFIGVKNYLPDKFESLIDRTRISCMVIGGIGAFTIIKYKPFIIKYIYSKQMQIAAMSIFVIILLDFIKLPFYNLIKNEIFAFISIILLINIATNRNALIDLENGFLDYLGKISYGIYVYHSFSAVICIQLFSFFTVTSSIQYYIWSISLIISVTLLTVLFSHFSYTYFEKIILKNKVKYSTILSGDLSQGK